jgi:hypothetical protein
MLEIVNRTRYTAAAIPYTNAAGIDHVAVIVKGTFTLVGCAGRGSREGQEPPLADEMAPVEMADIRTGEDPQASLRYEADTGWPKVATDVVLVGAAVAPRRERAVDVTLRIGPLTKTVRVFGDRCWARGAVGWRISDPVPFERMALVWERAFGGEDKTHKDQRRHGFEARNPVGTGLALWENPQRLAGLRLPNLERPAALIKAWTDRPEPVAFAPIHRHWLPRRSFAGTYDDAWTEDRAPLLPVDFDDRFFSAVSPDLVASPYLQGGEPVQVSGVHEAGLFAFLLPRRKVVIAALIKGQRIEVAPRIDTVWIGTEEQRLIIIWRAGFPCPRSLLKVEALFIREAT